MTFLNYGKQAVANLIYASGGIPAYFVLGSGSGLTSVTDTNLLNPVDVQAFTSKDNSTAYQVAFQGDWNSVEISGLQLREFGISVDNSLTGSLFSKTSLPAINFDGTNELRITENWVVF
jgi:hypothetical protein